MDVENLQVLPLHKHPEFLIECCDLINDEWPRSKTARMMSLKASGDILPTSLILINDKKLVIGHCKLTPIPNIPESCFIETVVISKALRGKKLGTYLMKKVEEHCKNILKLSMVYLSTKGQEKFYAKLGYEICSPVSIYGTCINHRIFNGHTDEKPVPVVSGTSNMGVPPPPPPPPPMPENGNLNRNHNIKSNKTYMFKYLS